MRGQRLLVFALGVAILVSTCASSNSKPASRSLSDLVKELQDRTTNMTEFRHRLPQMITQIARGSYEEASQEMSLEELDHIFVPKQQFKRLATSTGANLQEYQGVQGRPGVDFPVLPSIPKTSFNCKQVKNSGYYADPETDCQVFHICADGRKISFLCPNGTIFRQSHLICDWWWTVDCAASRELYDASAEQLANDQRIYRARADALSQSRARQQGGRKPGVIREYEAVTTTARPRQLSYNSISRPSSSPRPQSSGDNQEIQFSRNYYSSQDYQATRTQPPPTQAPLSPFRSAVGTREEFQQGRSTTFASQQQSPSGNRQAKQFEQELSPPRFDAPSSSLSQAQTTSRPFPQTTSRPLFGSTSIPQQQSFNRPQQLSTSRPTQQDPFPQQTGRPFNNRQRPLNPQAKNTFTDINGQQSVNRNNQQQSFSPQADRLVHPGRSLEFKSPQTPRPVTVFSSSNNQGRTGGQSIKSQNFQAPASSQKLPQSQKQSREGKGRSYNHYTLFYDSEGERQQPAETGSFVGNRGNQFTSSNKQQFPSQFKDIDNSNTEEKIKFLGGVSPVNFQNESSSDDFAFQKNKALTSSKSVLDVAHSRRVKPLVVQVARTDGASKLIPEWQVPEKELLPPEEQDTFNTNSSTSEISKVRQEMKMDLEKNETEEIFKESKLNLNYQISNEGNGNISNFSKIDETNEKDAGFPGIAMEISMLNDDFNLTEVNTESYSEGHIDLEPPPADEIVENINFGDISMQSKLIEQPSLFEFSNLSTTTDMPLPTTTINEFHSAQENGSQDSLLATDDDVNMKISEHEIGSHLRNNNGTEISEESVSISDKPTSSTDRSSRRRKPTTSTNIKLIDDYNVTTPTTIAPIQRTSKRTIETEVFDTVKKSGTREGRRQKSSENNPRTMRARTRSSVPASASTEQSVLSSRSSRYRIPSLRIIEVTIRSSSTPSPYRVTVPLIRTSKENSIRGTNNIASNLFFPDTGILSENINIGDEILSLVSPANPSSRSGRFRTPTTVMPKTRATVSKFTTISETNSSEAVINDSISIKSDSNTNSATGESEMKAKIQTQSTSVHTPEPDTINPPLLLPENNFNESLNDSIEHENNSEEISVSPMLESEEFTDKPFSPDELFSTEPHITNTSQEAFETTTLPSPTTAKPRSSQSRRKMGRQRVPKPDMSDLFEVTSSEENSSSSGLAIALSRRARPNRVQISEAMGEANNVDRKKSQKYNITSENSSEIDTNVTTLAQSEDSSDGANNIILENFTLIPQISNMHSDNDTDEYSLELEPQLSSEENLDSSFHDSLIYNKFGIAEYDAENVSRKLYVHLNRTISPKPDSRVNATGRLLFIEQNLPEEINSEENIEYKVRNESNIPPVSSVTIPSKNGNTSEGRKSVKYTELQRQREKVSVSDSRRRYRPSTSTEKPARTTKKSITSEDSFTQVTKSLYTKLTRELLPPREEQPRDDSLDINNSNRNLETVSYSAVKQNQTGAKETFESSREGLDVPPSLGPKALHSLSVYFATDSENARENDGQAIANNVTEENTSNVSTSTEDNTSFVSATLPPLFTSLSKNSNTRLTTVLKKLQVAQPPTRSSAHRASDNTTEMVQGRTKGKSRNQVREERARKIDTAIKELQEDYRLKLSNSENIHTQHESSLNFTSSNVNVSDLIGNGNKSPDLRALAQVFSRALSAYLDDPEEFRKALSDIQPTEPSSLTSEDDTHSTTFSNNIELSSISTVSTDYPSATKEDDEVLDFSDVTKLPMSKRPAVKDIKGSRHRATDILNADSSSYTAFNGARKTSESTVMELNKSRSGKSESSLISNEEIEKMQESEKQQRVSSSVPKDQTTRTESKFSEWLHSTPDPSTIAQEVNSLFAVSDEGHTTPPDRVNYTSSTYETSGNQTYFTPTAGGVNDGSRPRYGGFQNNLEAKTTTTNYNKGLRSSRRKSTVALPIEEIVEPTTFSPLTKYIINTEPLPTDLTPPKDEDIPWSEEVKKEEIIDDVLGTFVPEDLNNLAESDSTAPAASDDDKSVRGSRKHNLSGSENGRGNTAPNSRRRSGGDRISVTNKNTESHMSNKGQNSSENTTNEEHFMSEMKDSRLNTNTESQIASNAMKSNFSTSGSHVENSQQTVIPNERSQTSNFSKESIVYSKDKASEHISSEEKSQFDSVSSLTIQDLPLSGRRSSVIYSDVINTTPDYFLLRSGKSKSENNNRNSRQRMRAHNAPPSELSDSARITSSVNITTDRKNETTLNSRALASSIEGNVSSSTPIPTSGYTSYSNVEISSKSMVRVTPNASRRQSRKFKSTTITTLTKNNRQHVSSSSANATKNTTGDILEHNLRSDAVSIVTPTTVTEMINPMLKQTAHHSVPSKSASQRDPRERMSSKPSDSERNGRRLQSGAGARNSTNEVRDMMVKFTEAMEAPEQARAMEHLRRMLSGSNATGRHEQMTAGMPELNVTSATALLNVMKTATTNSTVRRLVLLLVNDSLKDNSIQEAQVRLLEAILRLPDDLSGQASGRSVVAPVRRRPRPQGSRGTSRRGRKYSTTTTTEEPSTTETSTDYYDDQTTPASNEDESGHDENYVIDDRAVSLLRSLFTLASRWG